MKKTFLIFSTLLLASCSSDNSSTNSDNTSINPPNWIQGTWYLDNNGTADKSTGYTFKKNDFCLNVFNTQTCFGESNNLIKSGGGYTEVEEEKSDNEYKISITQVNTTVIYHFKKITAKKIEWINDPIGDLDKTFYINQ